MQTQSDFLKSILLLCLTYAVLLTACSKKELPILSTEKMPITTTSQAALSEYTQGLVFADKLQRAQAATHFKSAIGKDPTFATAWLNLALVSTAPNEFMAYLDSAQNYAAMVSEGEQLLIQAVEYGLQGNTVGQGEAFGAAVALFPGDERLHNLQGNFYFGIQQYQLAIKAYSRAVMINENLAAPYNMLGYAQRSLGNYGEAEKAFKMYIRLNPGNPNAFDSYAELLLEMGRYKESNEFYLQALDLDSTFASSYIGMATNYSFLNEFGKAREQIELLKALARDYMEKRQAFRTEALISVYEGKLLQALEPIQKSLDLSIENEDAPNIASDLMTLGDGYLELGQPEKAIQYYEKARDKINNSALQSAIIENGQTVHKYNIARAFAAQGKFEEARKIAAEFNAIVVQQKNPVQIGNGHQLNGIVALYEKKYQEVIDELGQANQLNPYNLYRIGEAYDGLGKHDEGGLFKQRAAELNALNSFDQALVISKTRINQAS